MSQAPDPVALEEAIRLLSRRNLSAGQLQTRLAAKYGDQAEAVVAYAVGRGLVRDHSVAAALVAKADREGRGDEWLSHQMVELGLSSAPTALPEVERARIALKKKSPSSAARFLASRGFTAETIASIIEERDGD